eukprot:UN05399
MHFVSKSVHRIKYAIRYQAVHKYFKYRQRYLYIFLSGKFRKFLLILFNLFAD